MLIDRTPVLPEEWETLRPKLGADVPEELLRLALTHPSSVGEGVERTMYSNQRLEFLGDTILGAVTAEYLFRHHEDWPEGLLTQRRAALVQKVTLARVARRMELGKYLILGAGEFRAGGANRDGILSDALEAILAVVFLTGGLDAARAFFERWFAEELEAGGEPVPVKNRLQEMTQANGLGTPTYETRPGEGSSGKPHERRYASRVSLHGEAWGEGAGTSKKAAESSAAQAAFVRVQTHVAALEVARASAQSQAEPVQVLGEGEDAACLQVLGDTPQAAETLEQDASEVQALVEDREGALPLAGA